MNMMKLSAVMLAAVLGTCAWAQTTTNYYVIPSSPVATDGLAWTNWATAHTNLIEVAQRARDGDTICATNLATYRLTNQVVLADGIALRSWAPDGGLDPATTVLDGNYPLTTNRCLYLNNYHASAAGFTIANGADFGHPTAFGGYGGGGIMIKGGGHLANCIIASNRYYGVLDGSTEGGGGLYCYSASGTVHACVISDNTSYVSGGGIKTAGGGAIAITDCTIINNTCSNYGGGISHYGADGLKVIRCEIASNTANRGAGGHLAYAGLLDQCRIIGNTSTPSGLGGGLFIGGAAMVRNSLIYTNISTVGGGIYIIGGGLIQNCTVLGNKATDASNRGGGLQVYSGTGYVENCIVWGNYSSGTRSNYYLQQGSVVLWLTNSCVPQSPAATNAFFVDCLDADPKLDDGSAAGAFGLAPDSECINRGIIRDWMLAADAADLGGRTRVDRFSGRVDMGCYEYLLRGSIFRAR